MAKPSQKKRPKQGIFYHLYGLLMFALALLLPCQLLLGWALHNNAKFTLPHAVTEKIRAKLKKSGVDARFGKIEVSLPGRVAILDLELGQPQRKEPLVTVKRLVADFDLFDLWQGAVAPKRVLLDGGTLYSPATTAPNSQRRVVFKDIRASVSQEGQWLNIDTIQTRLGDMPLVGYDMLIPKPSAVTSASTSDGDGKKSAPSRITSADWQSAIRVAEVMLELQTEMEKLGRPSLEVTTLPGTVSNNVVFLFSARGEKFSLPGNAVATDAHLTFAIRFDGEKTSPGRNSRLTVGGATWTSSDGKIAVQTGALTFVSRFAQDWSPPTSGDFSASDITFNGEKIAFAQGRVDWRDFPKLTAQGLVVDETDCVHFSGNGNYETREVTADFSARIEPNRHLESPKVKPFLPEELATLRFDETPSLAGTVRFASDFKFAQLDITAALGAGRFEDFRLVEGNAKMRLTPDRFEVLHADLRARHHRAQGRFFTGFTATSEYRVAITGNTQPEFLNKFLPDWWPQIWDAVKLNPENLPLADLDIHGQWEGRPDEFVFCAVAGREALIRGQKIDHAELRIVELPDKISLFDILAVQDGLSAGGHVIFQYNPPPKYALHSVRFNVRGSLPKKTAIEMVGEGLPEILEPLQVQNPVKGDVTGWFHFDGSPTPDRLQVFVAAEGNGPMSAWNVPFADFQGTVAYDDDIAVITANRGTFAGGKIIPISLEKYNDPAVTAGDERSFFGSRPSRAWLDVRGENPRLRIDAEILNAQRVAFFDGLARLKDDYQPPAPSPTAAPDTSRMNIRFNGTVTVPQLETLAGVGHVHYLDPNIPNLHLFGGLSRVLNSIGLGVTSFSLDRAESDFTIQKNKIYFPNVKITGPDCNVMTAGNYDFAQDQLNFRAMLTVTVGNDIPIVGSVMNVVNRIPRLTPVNITGTLDNPSWSLDPSPSVLWGRQPLDTSLGTPPATDVDDGEEVPTVPE